MPGRIQDVYNKIDKLERNINNLTNNQIQQELQKIKQEVSNVNAVLQNQDSQAFLDDLEDEYKHDLPNPDNRKMNYLVNRYGLKTDDEVEFLEE